MLSLMKIYLTFVVTYFTIKGWKSSCNSSTVSVKLLILVVTARILYYKLIQYCDKYITFNNLSV